MMEGQDHVFQILIGQGYIQSYKRSRYFPLAHYLKEKQWLTKYNSISALCTLCITNCLKEATPKVKDKLDARHKIQLYATPKGLFKSLMKKNIF